jgi:hypothetical protein
VWGVLLKGGFFKDFLKDFLRIFFFVFGHYYLFQQPYKCHDEKLPGACTFPICSVHTLSVCRPKSLYRFYYYYFLLLLFCFISIYNPAKKLHKKKAPKKGRLNFLESSDSEPDITGKC